MDCFPVSFRDGEAVVSINNSSSSRQVWEVPFWPGLENSIKWINLVCTMTRCRSSYCVVVHVCGSAPSCCLLIDSTLTVLPCGLLFSLLLTILIIIVNEYTHAVNLMDMERATALVQEYKPPPPFSKRRASIKQHHAGPLNQNTPKSKQRRESFFHRMLGASVPELEDVKLNDISSSRPRSRRSSRANMGTTAVVTKNMLKNSHDDFMWDGNEAWCSKACKRCRSCFVCSLPILMLVIAVVTVGALVFPLVEDALHDMYRQKQQHGSPPKLVDTPVQTSLVPTKAPTAHRPSAALPTVHKATAEEETETVALEKQDANETAANSGLFDWAISGAEVDTTKSMKDKDKGGPPPSISESLADRERWEDIKGLIIRKGISQEEDFEDDKSSQSKALEWIVAFDVAMEAISNDSADHLMEVYALTVFYFATHPKAKPHDGKFMSLPIPHVHSSPQVDWIRHGDERACNWAGVSCGHLHNVVALNLTSTGLEGTLCKELSALHHLINLDLSNNKIGGSLPLKWGKDELMKKLRLVDLSNNDLEGSIPSTWKELQLEVLNVAHNDKMELE